MMYTSSTDNLQSSSVNDATRNYCICVLMRMLFVISGKYNIGKYDRSCMLYDKVTVRLLVQLRWKKEKKQHVKFCLFMYTNN